MTKHNLSEALKEDEEQIMTKQMPHMKPPTQKTSNCNRGTALEQSVENYRGRKPILLA